jgi:NitT/TauT family transport system substrate-binding protein
MKKTQEREDIIHLYSRRRFLKAASSLALSAAGLSLLEGCASAANVPTATAETLETSTIRLPQITSLCSAPLIIAEDFLKAEGFTDVQYIPLPSGMLPQQGLTDGHVDMTMTFSSTLITSIGAGDPLVLLAGVHIGCFKLFVTGGVHTIRDLKGKRRAIAGLAGADRAFASSMAAYVGLDPNQDIQWITTSQAKQVFIDGGADAILAFPPAAQELQNKQIGQMIVDSMMDKPWSQYFCCKPVSTKVFFSRNQFAYKSYVG